MHQQNLLYYIAVKRRLNGSVVQKQRSHDGVKLLTPHFQWHSTGELCVRRRYQFNVHGAAVQLKQALNRNAQHSIEFVYVRQLVVLGVKENSSLCIIAVDHRQPQGWNGKLALALVRSLV